MSTQETLDRQETIDQLRERVDELEDEVTRLRKNYVSESTLLQLLDALGGETFDVDDNHDRGGGAHPAVGVSVPTREHLHGD
ncbi:MAG: hypothetical protein ABEJ61_11440 [Haloferacaceae archaeon]